MTTTFINEMISTDIFSTEDEKIIYCQDENFSIGLGECDSYGIGEKNHEYCKTDCYGQNICAYNSCPQCGVCISRICFFFLFIWVEVCSSVKLTSAFIDLFIFFNFPNFCELSQLPELRKLCARRENCQLYDFPTLLFLLLFQLIYIRLIQHFQLFKRF